MSDFGFQITADASSALRAEDSVLDRLERIRQEAAKASEGMPFDKMASGFKSVQSALGPIARELGVISGLVSGGIGGAVSSLVSGLVSSISNIGAAAARARERLVEMRDVYIVTSNAARKFADAGHSVSRVIAEQQALANGLHASLQSTMSLYEAVRDGTDELNLSHSDQIRLTKSLGEAVQLAGRSIDSASGIMAKLSFAMATGSISGGELKMMMREVPALADLWTRSLGMTRKELIELANKGLLDVNRLINPLIDNTERLDQAFSTQRRTTAQWREALRSAFEIARGSGKDSLDAIQTALEQTADTSIDLATRQKAAAELAGNAFEATAFRAAAFQAQFLETAPVVKTFNEILEDTVAKLHRIEDQFDRAQRAATSWDHTLQGTSLFGTVKSALGNAADAWLDATKYSREYAVAVDNARKSLRSLEAAHAAGGIPLARYREEKQRLLAIIDGTTKAHGAEANKVRDLTKEYEKLARALLGYDSAAEQALRRSAADRSALTAQVEYLSQLDSSTSFSPLKRYRAEMSQLLSLSDDPDLTQRGADYFRKAYLDALGLSDAVFGAANATETYRHALEKLNEAKRAGAVTDAEYARAQRKLFDESFGDAERERIKALTESWNERIKQMQEQNRALAESFRPIGDAIRDAFMGGELSAKSLDATLRQLSFNLFKFMALQAAAKLSTVGGAGAFAGTVLKGIFGAAHGAVIYEGHGGTDSQLLAIRKSPNERVTIETPEQYLGYEPGLRSGRGGPVSVTVVPRTSTRDIVGAFTGFEGEQVIAEYDEKYRRRRR